MKLGQRHTRLVRYCEEVAEFYPVKCEVKVLPGKDQDPQDSDWAFLIVHDITDGASNGNTRKVTSPPSPAVHCLESYLDDLMVKWFGDKNTQRVTVAKVSKKP